MTKAFNAPRNAASANPFHSHTFAESTIGRVLCAITAPTSSPDALADVNALRRQIESAQAFLAQHDDSTIRPTRGDANRADSLLCDLDVFARDAEAYFARPARRSAEVLTPGAKRPQASDGREAESAPAGARCDAFEESAPLASVIKGFASGRINRMDLDALRLQLACVSACVERSREGCTTPAEEGEADEAEAFLYPLMVLALSAEKQLACEGSDHAQE